MFRMIQGIKEFEPAKYIVKCRFCQVNHAPPKKTVLRLAGALLAPADPTSGIHFDFSCCFLGRNLEVSLRKTKDIVSG